MEYPSMARRVEALYRSTALDAYGDEGDGYDFEKFIELLVSDGWTPPSEVPQGAFDDRRTDRVMGSIRELIDVLASEQ